ncbi:MAG TPA: hypothetical protein VGF17_29100, partial [Phytomonospora sp.]
PTFKVPPPPGFAWADQASRLTGRSIEQLYKDRQMQNRLGHSNGPRSVTIGRKAAWRITDIAAWLDAQTSVTADPRRVHESRPAEPRIQRRRRALAGV